MPRARIAALLLLAATGCRVIPVDGNLRTSSTVNGAVQATVDVRMPTTPDPGPMVEVVVKAGNPASRIALIDVDGLLVNQNLTGLYSVGENPVAAFREKLEAAAADPAIRAVVLRINSPGGGVTAADILAEELRRFKDQTKKPVVACLMDLATGGGYYLAVGADAIIAHPTAIVGGLGAIVNHYNLRDAMATFNVTHDPVKAGPLVDMGSITTELPEDSEARKLLQQMADGFRDRFLARVSRGRPTMTEGDRRTLADGRVVAAPSALATHLVDALGYLDDALIEAGRRGGCPGGQVVLFRRASYPTRSIYGVTPNVPLQGELVPVSFPGLERAKLPTFLYLWQPDPTYARSGGR